MSAAAEHSPLTCVTYSTAITSIRRLYEDHTSTSFHLPESLRESDLIIEILSKQYQKSTLLNFISAVLWILNKQTDTTYTEEYIESIKQSYRNHGAQIKAQIERNQIGKEFQLTEKEQKSFLVWEKILETYHRMLQHVNKRNYNSFMDFVIVSLYVLHPPVRADYANMKLFIEDSHIPENESGNYCVLQTNPRFVFQKYKTAKHRGTTVIPITAELHDILMDWAELNTSDYLLSTSVKSTQTLRPMSENTLSKRITAIFMKHTAIPVTINTLRHSFISYMSKHDQEYDNKRNNADKMMHSLSMADRYRRMVYLE